MGLRVDFASPVRLVEERSTERKLVTIACADLAGYSRLSAYSLAADSLPVKIPSLFEDWAVSGPPERVQRRLAAIFAADVAGYSRLMAQDEIDTLQALTAHREVMDRLIAEHGGRIANT